MNVLVLRTEPAGDGSRDFVAYLQNAHLVPADTTLGKKPDCVVEGQPMKWEVEAGAGLNAAWSSGWTTRTNAMNAAREHVEGSGLIEIGHRIYKA